VRAIKRQPHEDDAASTSKRERKEEEKEKEGEKEKASETFEDFVTPHKSERSCTADNFHSVYDDRIIGGRFQNDEQLASNESSKSVANVRRSRSIASRLEPAGSKVRRGCPEREINRRDVYVYGVYLHKDELMFGNKRFDVDDADTT